MIIYATRVNVEKSAAQSHQVLDMAQAFYTILKGDFVLISVGSKQITSLPHCVVNTNNTLLKYILILVKVYKMANRKCSIVFTRDIGIAFLASLLNVKVTIEVHRSIDKFIPRILMRYLSTRIHFIGISNAVSMYLITEFNVRSIKTFHDGAFECTESVQEAREALEVMVQCASNTKIFLHTGSLYKGGIEHLEELSKATGHDDFIVHIGGQENEIARWQDHFSKRNCKNVKLYPNIDRGLARKLQKGADFLIYVSNSDSDIYWCTSPLKIFEYMSSGKPIISTRGGAVDEILNNSNSIELLSSEFDNEGQLRKSIKNEALHKKISKTAYEQFQMHHSWGIRASSIIDWVRKCR